MSRFSAVTSPHYLASEAGKEILLAGGNAVEACIAMASTLTVVYPHMTSLGGDGFWLIHKPGQKPVGINAAGRCAQSIAGAEFGLYQRGPKSALTTAGAVAGWEMALMHFLGDMTLEQMFMPAINYASNGFKVTESLRNAQLKLSKEVKDRDFSDLFLKDGKAYQTGDTMRLPALADTYRSLAENGLSEWYKGDLATESARYLRERGSPVTAEDIADTSAKLVSPLTVKTHWGDFYNLGAPTQGGASLNIIALLDRYLMHQNREPSYWCSHQGEEELLHFLIEAVKIAFNWRNTNLYDGEEVDDKLRENLSYHALENQLNAITGRAAVWPEPGPLGDTVWMGAVDSEGLSASYIQSIYWEFGSAVANPGTGVVWNNRSVGFSPDPEHPNYIRPGRQPMHTLNPALALLNDGSRLIYGSMGGEGQPQTQAAMIWRYLVQKRRIGESLALPRWLLGKTWGKPTENLKLEERLFAKHGQALSQRGHDLVSAPDKAEYFGHAGMIHVGTASTGAASDPRSDGKAIII